jgi:hypothetical protein
MTAVRIAAALLAVSLALPARAAPQLQPADGQGLQAGATTVLTLTGSGLLPAPRLILPLSGAGQAVRPGATAQRVEVAVTLPADAAPGIWPVWLANETGISNPALVAVDHLPTLPAGPPLPQLPAAVRGAVAGSDTVRVPFAGRKGQRLLVEVEARRLGSALDPAVTLLDGRRVQVAWAMGSPTLGGDTRLEAVLPADGPYTVEVHDVLYRAAAPGFFRLVLGDLRAADLALPVGVRRGKTAAVELLGLPGTVSVTAAADETAAFLPAPLPPRPDVVGSAPVLAVSDHAEEAQAPAPPGKVQEVPVPGAVSGRLLKPGQEDRYRLPVKPGQKLRFDVLAQRVGSPLDGVLTVRTEAGAVLAQDDDRGDTADPGLDVTVPAGVTALVVGLTDQRGRAGPGFAYRIAATEADRPEFTLTVTEERVLVPRGGVAVVRVQAARAGYAGPIRLELPGLPEGVRVSGAEVPAGANDTLLSLEAPAGQPLAQLLTRVVGTAGGPPAPVRRAALRPATEATQRQPWLRAEVGFAVVPDGPIAVAWDTADAELPRGGLYPAKVKLARAPTATGPVRLSLVTTQTVPKKPDGQDDPNRALRLEGAAQIGAGQTAGVASVRVPADLPPAPYDLLLRAELLSPDGKTVLATATTPGRRVTVGKPPAKP